MARLAWRTGRPPEVDGSGEPLPPLGRASRARVGGRELWRLPHADENLARRLLGLGLGLVEGGVDDEGAWLLREIPEKTADALARGERVPSARAVRALRDIACSLQRFEESSLSPGRLSPDEIALGESGAWLAARAYLAAKLGELAPQRGGSSGPSPRWTPPEQAEGADWDSAANRYVLALVVYRMLAGEHPFAGAGVRHALDEMRRGVAPLPDDAARALAPGVQALLLAMLDPSPSRRPRSAAEVVRRLDEATGASRPARAAAREVPAERPLLRAERPVEREPPRAAARPSRATPPERRPLAGGRARALALAAPIAAGALALAGGWLASPAVVGPGSAPSGSVKPIVRAVEPLASAASAGCGGCHPAEVDEWNRSVMAHSLTSPLFGGLDSVVQEQVGRDARCPNGAGILRRPGATVCRDPTTGVTTTGAGGEHWCVNCHAGGENIAREMPGWDALGDPRTRAPTKDLLSAQAREGVSCALCHMTRGAVGPHGATAGYEGNPTWASPATGAVFPTRPEDGAGRFGVGNSGYRLEPDLFLVDRGRRRGATDAPVVHRSAPAETRSFLKSSEFCGTCHDVRLFGTDVLGAQQRGEHFKRLRNGYSEWRAWADGEERAGRKAATCQDCHMGLYPGICRPGGPGGGGCPTGTTFERRAPGERPKGGAGPASPTAPRASHYFTSVDIPLGDAYADALADATALDGSGLPLGLRARRDMLLRHTFRFEIGRAARDGQSLNIPIEIENVGAGHRVPAGFSQEREIWVELTVKDGRGAVVYEVGKLPRPDADLADKIFVRINTGDGGETDRFGRPLGVFGADVVDGPDAPRWSPPPQLGGVSFRGKGLINFQNGFLRCVRCIGFIDAAGACQPGPGQGRTRADRFDDGAYDIDTGECRSNLSGPNALFETYFPVGALDADRGVFKAPDAIIDTRSLPPRVPAVYTYVLDVAGRPGPFTARAVLHFRAFPPYLVRAFAAYEARMAARGARPSGAQVKESMLRRVDVVDLGAAEVRVE